MKHNTNTVSRRSVIQGIAGATLAATAPRLRAQNRSDVLVIGAGLSGLNAALLLQEAGLNVRVIEGRDRIGGRVLSYRSIPGNPEAGGTAFGPGYARLVDAARTHNVGAHRYHADHAVLFPARTCLARRIYFPRCLARASVKPVPRTGAGGHALELPAHAPGAVESDQDPGWLVIA